MVSVESVTEARNNRDPTKVRSDFQNNLDTSFSTVI